MMETSFVSCGYSKYFIKTRRSQNKKTLLYMAHTPGGSSSTAIDLDAAPPRNRTAGAPIDLDASPQRPAAAAGDQRAASSPRTGPVGAPSVVCLSSGEDTDDECREVLAPPRPAPGPGGGGGGSSSGGDLDGEGLVVLGTSGGLLAENLPHPRCDCPLKQFFARGARRTIVTNEASCDQCYCFVCECRARECSQWRSSDAKRPAHCNAHSSTCPGATGASIWRALRRERRERPRARHEPPPPACAHGP